MRPVLHVGYYDQFYFWSCECLELPNATEELGSQV